MDRNTACGGRSLTSCRRAAPVLAGGMPCTFCGCSSVGRARPRHMSWGSGPRVRDSSSAPLRVCPCTPRPRDMVLVVRDVRDPWPDHVQRDTTSDGTLALGHSRSGTFSPWLSRQGSHLASGRPRVLSGAGGAPTAMSRSSRRPRTPPFQGGYAGSNPARDARTRNLRRAHASGVETGRNDWAAPEPVTGWITWGCSSTPGRAAALQAAGYRFESCHLHHMAKPR